MSPVFLERWPRPSVMGIVNVTPDSFSDGGSFRSAVEAAAAAQAMLDAGAALVDVGGESTRPNADPVSLDEELGRVLPVLEALPGRPLSVDTSRAEVARSALALGAVMVNDVTALRGDPKLAEVVADAGVDVCLMHMRGTPRTMQDAPRYDDVVSDVTSFLEERIAFAVEAGIAEDRMLSVTAGELEDIAERIGEILQPYMDRVGRPETQPEGARTAVLIQLGFPFPDEPPP